MRLFFFLFMITLLVSCEESCQGLIQNFEKNALSKKCLTGSIEEGMVIPGRDLGDFKQISAGYYHTCGIRPSGKLYCWGQGSGGKLGTGNTKNSLIPVEVVSGQGLGNNVKSVSAGDFHTCAIRIDGKVFCWGYGFYGNLGNGSTNLMSSTPVAVQTGEGLGDKVKSITTGYGHSCAIREDGKVFCWGKGEHGKLGTGTTTDSATPVAVLTGEGLGDKVIQISGTRDTNCALRYDGKVFCWGYGYYGNLGNGTNSSSSTPVAVSNGQGLGENVIKINAKGTNCAIRNDGKAFCWGIGQRGQLGNNTTGFFNTSPVAVLNGEGLGERVLDIASAEHTCAVRGDGKLFCWGASDTGQTGYGTTTDSKTPMEVSFGDGLSDSVKSISTGFSHSCAIREDGKAFCWGKGADGRLGNGSDQNQLEPSILNL